MFLFSSTVAVSVGSVPTKLDWKPDGLVYGEEVSGVELQNEELLDGPVRNVL